ncbi:MAG TPA: TIGR00341 family protein [Candidatus Deferrimicrobiaceae bacterium]|nr:TIGR00341 family protein [Candidatus Deferrimicrobiaceae bacterium]
MWPGLSKARSLLSRWRQGRAASINPKSVVKDVQPETEASAGYFLALSVANLIALCGLHTNSLAVIIGAMLISPLMGPILSAGFACVTGNKPIGRQALKKIAFSIFLTLIVAAFATLLSPLKNPTAEILARTRPNFYDLVIAFLAGAVGATAICTKKNYLTVVPGVAIATAVIPPLSVAGYGLGVGSLRIFGGGFLLFFSNFVSIIISTEVVFFIYGFSPGSETKEDVQQLKKRMVVLLAILFVITIPLVYTVHKTISEVALRTSVKGALRDNFDKTDVSHLAGFDYSKPGDKVFEIRATINTVRFLSEERISEISNNVWRALSKEVKLSVEQILVQKGGLREKALARRQVALVYEAFYSSRNPAFESVTAVAPEVLVLGDPGDNAAEFVKRVREGGATFPILSVGGTLGDARKMIPDFPEWFRRGCLTVSRIVPADRSLLIRGANPGLTADHRTG